jgi:SAM-dependent methyltransferase
MERRGSFKVLEQSLTLDKAEIVDVGCGDGWLARAMAKRGAFVTGVEISPKMLVRARSFGPVGNEHFIQGSAEDLPLPTRSADVVVFFNALHHVDKQGLPKALRESARVLKSGGILYISEPTADGPYFDVMRPVHDETQVRKDAQDILAFAPEYGLILEKQMTHLDSITFADFDAFHDRITSINPHVRTRFDEDEENLREHFEALGVESEEGWSFDQPMRVAMFRRA